MHSEGEDKVSNIWLPNWPVWREASGEVGRDQIVNSFRAMC